MLIFISVKMHALVSHTFFPLILYETLVSQQLGLCVFRCVASAAHFFYLDRRENMKKHYEVPEMEWLLLSSLDVIAASDSQGAETEDDGDGNELPGVNNPFA